MDVTDPIVATNGLTKRYGDRLAVDGVSLTVRRGEVYGFVGPNGAGKSTALRMLLGLVRPTSGEASVLGRPPGAPEALARIGALVEGPAFFPYLSGRDNLRLLARYTGLDDAAVEVALGLVDLTGRAADRFRRYSLGMKQRLGVAAALLGEPDLLILDEPTNGLDPAGMADMRALVRSLTARGHTVLLSSHLLGEVQQVCDRIGVIAAGRLVAERTVADVRGEAGLLVRGEPLPAARAVAARLIGADRVSIVDDTLRLATGQEAIPALNRAFVSADIEVYELRPVERTLEEAYFALTGARPDDRDEEAPT